MANWSTTTKHEPSSINNGRRYELRDRVSIEQLNNMTENSFYAMEASSVAKEKAEEALKFAQGSGTTVYENGSPVAEFNADKKVDNTKLEQDYYTKQQVDDILASGSIDVDLSNYYKKSETYSKEEVDDKLANLDVDIDFSDYYTKTETNDLLKDKADKSVVNTIQDDVGTLKIDNASNKASISNLQNLKADKDSVTLELNKKADKTEIPYVGNFITNAVDDLVNYYTKSETYTQAEVRQLISAIPKFNIEVVTGLPTNPNETTIYLLRATTGETGNLYSEYIYTNGAWEKLGEQKLDLSGYATTESVNESINSLKKEISTGNFVTSDMVYDFNQTKKFVTEEEKTYWNGKVNVDVSNLTNYYKKAEIYTKTETSDLLDAGLSTKANKTDLNNYVTNIELEQKGYLTKVPDNYATKSDVQTSVSSLDSEFRTLLNNKADVSVVENLDTEIVNVAYNLSTVKNQYLKAVAVTNDGKTLTISDQDNKQIFFESGGTEYTAGAGIGISNGVISSLIKGVLSRKLASEQTISGSYVDLIFGTNLFTYGNVSYNSSNQIVIGKDIVAIKLTITTAFYNMSKEGYATIRIYKNGANIGEELWFSYQSGISGGGANSIIIPCSEGDTFVLKLKATSGHTGYVNNNTFVVAEVM